MKKIARIFEDMGGYFWVDEDCPLDTSGHCYGNKVSAVRSAAREGYTHVVGSGTYRPYTVHSIEIYDLGTWGRN